jgi:aquaporin Z
MSKKLLAEIVGTFWLVFGGCGSAVLALSIPDIGIGLVGVSLAFGLTVLTMAYAVGHVAGGHFNPAVSVGLCVAGRFAPKDLLPYVVAQVLGAVAAGGILYLIASGAPDFELGRFAANGYGENSPRGYSLLASAVTEVVMTMMFLVVILGATDRRAPAGFAPIARARAHADPPHQHPGDGHLGESGAQQRRRGLCRRLGGRAVVVVLDCADRRRRARRRALRGHRRGEQIEVTGCAASKGAARVTRSRDTIKQEDGDGPARAGADRDERRVSRAGNPATELPGWFRGDRPCDRRRPLVGDRRRADDPPP